MEEVITPTVASFVCPFDVANVFVVVVAVVVVVVVAGSSLPPPESRPFDIPREYSNTR